jgi:hypothetical protein
MIINFTPQRRNDTLTLELTASDHIRINGELFNFGPLGDGDTLSASDVPCDWLTGSITRINGEIHLTMIFPHGPNPPDHVAFPEPIHVTETGPITLPTETQDVDA